MINPFNRVGRNPEGSGIPPSGADGRDPALEELIEKAKELVAQARVYSSTRVDKAKVRVRQILVLLFLALLALLSLAGLLVGASEMVLEGMAGGFAALFGHRWLGELVAGLIIIGIVYGGYWLGMKKFEQSRIEKLRLKYEPETAVSRTGDGKVPERADYPAH